MRKVPLLSVTIGLLLLASTARCVEIDPALPDYKSTGGVSGSLKAVGSDTMNNLNALWAAGFKTYYPSVKFSVEGKGSGTAPPALIAGASQLGPMSRPMKPAEIAAFQRRYGYKPSRIRTAVDSLAVFINKDNPLKCLSLKQIDAIFSRTRRGGLDHAITTWGDLGLGGRWRDKPIDLYGRNSASGTYGYFKEVALFEGDYKDSVKEQPGSSAVVQGVASDPYAIGYSGIGYKTADVRAVPLRGANSSRCEEPDAQNAYSGAYPIARFLYIYLNIKPGRKIDPLLREFIKYIYSKQGQAQVVKAGYYPVTHQIARHDLKLIGIAE